MDIYDLCLECRNFFAPASKKFDRSFIHNGSFTIQNNEIQPLDFLRDGQYFRIVGSAVNDGVYAKTTEGMSMLQDETFTGQIWEMSVPKPFLELLRVISEWQEINEKAKSENMSPFTAESFAGYSYQKGSSQKSGNSVSWQEQFQKQLSQYRRLNVL